MRKLLRHLFLAAIFVVPPANIAQSSAQEATVDTEKISTVFAFNRTCYARVPDVQAISSMAAELAWIELDDDDLKAFETGGKLEVLDGWDALIGERVYRVAVSQGPLNDRQIDLFPGFADGKATSCTFITDGLDRPGVVAADMQALAGKEPVSKDVADGGLRTTTWAGGNDDIKVFLVSRSGDDNGGLLNVTVLTK